MAEGGSNGYLRRFQKPILWQNKVGGGQRNPFSQIAQVWNCTRGISEGALVLPSVKLEPLAKYASLCLVAVMVTIYMGYYRL